MGKMSREEWIILVGMIAILLVLLAIPLVFGQERQEQWAQEIEEKLRTLEDCSYVERFRGTPEEQETLSLCQRKRAQAKEFRRELEGIKKAERKFSVFGDVKRQLDITSLKVRTWWAVNDLKRRIGELAVRQQKPKPPPHPETRPL